MPNKKLETIKINSELYDFVREYCERENIRLIDFVEESLQNAVDYYEQLKLADENKKISSQLREKYDKIYKKGFDEGFFIVLYHLKGKAWAGSAKDTLRSNRSHPPWFPRSGVGTRAGEVNGYIEKECCEKYFEAG